MKHPMFNEEHEMFRENVRKFVQKEIVPNAEKWEEDEFFPDDIFKKLGKLGYMGAHFPEKYGGGGGDYLYSLILGEELAKGGMAGLGMGIGVVTGMAVPPILKFGTEEQKQKYVATAARG